MSDATFRPPPWLRNPHLQTILSGNGPRRWHVLRRARGLERQSAEWILDCGGSARLQGFFTPPAGGAGRGLAVLLHGWEGSARSTYVLACATRLHRAGHAVFRLNLRDHGQTHHLNRDLFHSCRLDEVVAAVTLAARRADLRPVSLVGFSLGANFALRVARVAPRRDLPLDRVVAVSPAIEPAHVISALERPPRLYERHFLERWRRSLRRKQELFPHDHDLEACLRLPGLRETTRHLVPRYGFDSLEAYFDGYSVAGSRLAGLEVAATVITAADDPIVPVEDVRGLVAGSAIAVEIQPFGGHVGFLDSLTRSWLDARIEAALDAQPSFARARSG